MLFGLIARSSSARLLCARNVRISNYYFDKCLRNRNQEVGIYDLWVFGVVLHLQRKRLHSRNVNDVCGSHDRS